MKYLVLMSGLTEPKHVKEFKMFFEKNYHKLSQESISISKHHCYSNDFVHDVYVKVYQNLMAKTGITGSFHAFVWRSMHNEYLMQYNREKKRTFIDYDNQLNHPVIEDNLQKKQDLNQQIELYYRSIEYICSKLFLFIETRHSPVKSSLFKQYFLMNTRRSTYDELVKRTGYSKAHISESIKNIKVDLKHNFMHWLNNNY